MAELHRHHSPKKICVVGSGNWGSVIAKIVGNNVCDHKEAFQETIQMYVYEEIVGGQKLTEIINTKHENVKYMPGCKIPANVFANPNVINACSDADILVFVLPHQFMTTLCRQLSGKIKPTAIGVSLVKGLDATNGELDLISNTIRRGLNIDCAVLMGANLASEVAQEKFCEATIGCRNAVTGQLLKDLFQTSYFRITVVPDEETVELCGALKNIVALAAGFADGLSLGDNTKAALIRIGLMEMIAFSRCFFPGSNLETFLQSCGIADLLTTAYGGGRNRRVSEAFAAGKGKTIEELEKVMLNGQKLQGPPTAAEVYEILVHKGKKDGTDWCKRFPIFTHVHMVCVGLLQPADFIKCLFNHPEHA